MVVGSWPKQEGSGACWGLSKNCSRAPDARLRTLVWAEEKEWYPFACHQLGRKGRTWQRCVWVFHKAIHFPLSYENSLGLVYQGLALRRGPCLCLFVLPSGCACVVCMHSSQEPQEAQPGAIQPASAPGLCCPCQVTQGFCDSWLVGSRNPARVAACRVGGGC